MTTQRCGYRLIMTSETPEPLEPLDDAETTSSEENDDSDQDIEGRYPDSSSDTVSDDREAEPGQPSSAIRPPQSG
jgi:hypothetical protein